MEPNESFDQDYTAAPRPSADEMFAELERRTQRQKVEATRELALLKESEAAVAPKDPAGSPGFFQSRSGNDDGFLKDTGQVVATGLTDAAEALLNLPGDVGTYLLGIETTGPGITLPRVTERPDSAAGEMAAAFTQFLVPYSAALKAVSAVSKAGSVAKAAVAGALTDFSVFDPHADRLSDLATKLGEGNPVFDNAFTEWMASEDSALEGRLKNSLEGAFIGSTLDTLMMSFKWLKAYRNEKTWTKMGETGGPDFRAPPEEAPPAKVDEPEAPAAVADEAAQSDPALAKVATEEPVALTPQTIGDSVRTHFTLKGEVLEPLTRALREGNLDEATSLVNFNADRIDWDSMEDGDQVIALMNAFEEVIAPIVEKATGGVQSFATTARIGNLVGYSAEQVNKLYATTRGEGGIAARMFAAHQTMVASARRLNSLAQAAKKSGSPEDFYKLHKQVELHAAVMASVKGSQTEIARALGAMRLMKQATAESFKEFDEIKRHLGGHQDTDAIIDRVLGAKNLDQINATVLRTTGRRIVDIITEVAINGLLSSAKTHVINLTSNAAQVVVGTMDRYVGVGVGRMMNAADRASLKEANAATVAMMQGLGNAARIAAQAFRQGVPISDIRQRVEFDARKAIYMDPYGREGAQRVLAQTVNLFGDVIRIPGRLLITGDEFFKTLNRSAEMAAQAYRQADREAALRKFKTPAARTAWTAKRRTELAAQPTPVMEQAVLDYTRRQTFQENAQTAFGPRVEAFLNFHPLWKLLIAPFVRTPMNLLRQAFVDRNPILMPIVSKYRAELAKGGPEAHMIIARTIVGAGFSTMALGLVENGIITGKGETFTSTEKMDKIPEYSIKVGDRYFVYNRLDPVGSIIGLVADMHYALKNGYDPTDPESETTLMEFVQAATMAVSANALNKTWAQSMADLMETLSIISESSDAVAGRKWEQFVAAQSSKLIPFSSAVRGTTYSLDPIVREAWSIRDRVFRILPGLSDELPPQRDLLGRVVERQNAEWFWLNPFGGSPEANNPVDRELARLEFDAGMLPKALLNGKLQLTTAQYSELKRLIGDFGNGMPTFEEQLTALFQKPLYARMSDPLRVNVVKSLMSSRAQAAQAILLKNDPELMKAFRAAQVKDVELLTGKTLTQ